VNEIKGSTSIGAYTVTTTGVCTHRCRVTPRGHGGLWLAMAAPRRTAAPTRKRARTAPAVTSATDIEEAPSFTDSEVAQVSASSIMQTAIRAGVAVLSWQKPCWLAHHLCALRVGVGVGREVCSTNVFNINAYAHLLKNCKWCTCVLYTRGGRLLSCLVSYPTAAAVARCAARCWPGMTRTTACCPGAATRARGAARQRRASRSPRPQTCRPACLRTGSGSARRAPPPRLPKRLPTR